jgi:hypothetical protein
VEANDRKSVKTRQKMWYELTYRGFKWKVLDNMEKGFKKRKRFDVVEMARRSEVDNRFNASSLEKYERGLLCSDVILRRTQKQVFALAASVGFSSSPTEEEGNM